MSSIRDRQNAFEAKNGNNNGNFGSPRNSRPQHGSNNQAPRRVNAGGNQNFGAPAETIDATVSDAIKRLLDLSSTTNWLIFNYDKGTKLIKEGLGDFEEFKNSFADDAVLYGYLRQPIGLDRRMKFVFVKWVGENVRPIQRARALDDCKRVQQAAKVFHLELSPNKRSDLNEKAVTDRLQAAAGANYDKEQNAAPTSGNSQNEFSSYKRTSKQFFENMEKGGNLKSIVFDKNPLARTTPVDLGGRSMTVGATDAKKNVIDLKVVKDAPQQRDEAPAAAPNRETRNEEAVTAPQVHVAEEQPKAVEVEAGF